MKLGKLIRPRHRQTQPQCQQRNQCGFHRRHPTTTTGWGKRWGALTSSKHLWGSLKIPFHPPPRGSGRKEFFPSGNPHGIAWNSPSYLRGSFPSECPAGDQRAHFLCRHSQGKPVLIILGCASPSARPNALRQWWRYSGLNAVRVPNKSEQPSVHICSPLCQYCPVGSSSGI